MWKNQPKTKLPNCVGENDVAEKKIRCELKICIETKTKNTGKTLKAPLLFPSNEKLKKKKEQTEPNGYERLSFRSAYRKTQCEKEHTRLTECLISDRRNCDE